MSFDDWILALHRPERVRVRRGLVVFWVLIVAVRRTDTPEATIRMAPVAKSGRGGRDRRRSGRIVFGIWLAFSVGGYDIWDGWIIAAIVLWVVAGGARRRTGKEYMEGMTRPRSSRPPARQGRTPNSSRSTARRTACCCTRSSSIALLLILIDMIWKPGA